MREVKLTITVNKPATEVFAFAIDPANTPKWLDFISIEETSDWPIKIGTTYRNKGTTDGWNEYVVSDFKDGELFVLSQKDGDYHVRYTVTSIDDHSCELEYYEWSDTGSLESPFTQAALDKFKQVIES